MAIRVTLDEVLLAHQLSLTELSQQTGLTIANLSVLKQNKSKAIRFTTLNAICRVLQCSPDEMLACEADQHASHSAPAGPPWRAAPQSIGAN